MPRLILVRHGQSQWNLENRFTGWWDVDLTEKGEAEARAAGELLKEKGILPTVAFTSLQTRAIKTLHIALEAAGLLWIPESKDWRLNERHYGGLTGLDKAETAAKHGADQVKIWRRSFDTPPPVLPDELPEMVESSTVRSPIALIPPPAPEPLELPEMVLFLMTVGRLAARPPAGALPDSLSLITTFSIVTCALPPGPRPGPR